MVFITGATGLVGNFVTRRFLEEGFEVTCLKRPHSDLALLADVRDRIRWVEGDIFDIRLLEQAVESAKIVVHCAAIVSYDQSDKEEVYKTNVAGAENIVNACLKGGVEKLVYVSSVAALPKPKSNGAPETKAVSAMKTNYGASKYLAELEVWRGHMEGLHTVILNPSVILGPGNWRRSSVRLFDYVWRENKFFVNGRVNCVDVRDVAEAVYQTALAKVNGEQYILSAGSISYQELFAKMALNFGKRPPAIRLSPFVLKAAYLADYLKMLATGRKMKITKEISQITQSFVQFNNNKIKEALNFDFRSIDESIQWTCRELMNMGIAEKKT